MNTIQPDAGNITRMRSHRLPRRTTSFKGGLQSLITEADKPITNIFKQHYGNIAERVGEKIGGLATDTSPLLRLSANARFNMEKGVSSIKSKKIPALLAENILFPFISLPLYAVSWVLKKLITITESKKIASLVKNNNVLSKIKNSLNNVYKNPLLRVPRKINDLNERTDILKGIYDKTKDIITKFAKENSHNKEEADKLFKEVISQLNGTAQTKDTELIKKSSEYIKESLYKVSNKFFDKHTGNYNTAFERPLNRIVSGLIPVLFLANDAYNLSVMCGDTKDMSKKEAKERQKQEISRVFTTAYIQLLVYGAFTKQVNTIPWFVPVTSALTVLFSEITSRKRLGKPIMFLSKEKAIEYNNRKKGKKTENKADKYDFIPADKKDPAIFSNIKSDLNKQPIKQETKNKDDNKSEKKALINTQTLKKGLLILIGSGFVLSLLKNSSLTKNSQLVKGIKEIGKFFKTKVYNPLAFKDFEMKTQDFEELTNSLKSVGCEKIAEGHEFIKNKYGKITDGIIKMEKGKLKSGAADIIAESAVNAIDIKNLNLMNTIKSAVKTAIKNGQTDIAESKAERIVAQIQEILTNKKVKLTQEQTQKLSATIRESITNNTIYEAIQVETKLKPYIDVLIEPFRFIIKAVKLPFSLLSNLINIAVSPIEKHIASAELGLTEKEITKFEKAIHRIITEIYGEKNPKSGQISQTIFVNAMDKLEKKTLPYRNAEEALKQAQAAFDKAKAQGINLNSDNEVVLKLNQAQKAFDKSRLKLKIFVDRAVEKSFNGVTQSSNKNTDLAMMSKLASSAVTSAFLVADNYNMVMLKSNGKDKEGAKEKANERIIQRLSALFYQSMLINWFNATFRSTYNSSLKGMTAVVIPNTLTTEILTRKSIGMPIGRKTYEELQAIDEKNENRKGFIGKYFKFMRLLTGKKPLKARITKNHALNEIKKYNYNDIKNNNPSTTNVLEMFCK